MLNVYNRYADIRIDAAFKICFGTEANKDNMIGLLGLLIPDAHIVDITFMDKEFPGFVMSEKTTIFDVYCKTEDGRRIIVEMQLKSQRHFVDRAIYYSTYPLREQLSTPMETEPGTIRSYGLRPVYTISIVDFSLDHDDAEEALTDGLLSSYSLRNDRNGERLSDTLHYVFFELGRFHYGKNELDRCSTGLEKLAYVFRYIMQLDARPDELAEDFFIRLFHSAELAGFTEADREKYDKDMTTELDKIAQLDYAREEGREEGRVEGREKEKIETAKKMLDLGIEVEIIRKVTSLSIEEIQKLQSK